jgi:hypothetical protein
MGLPEGYAPPKSQSRYMKFEQGSNKFQVLFTKGEPPFIWGWEVWVEEDGKRKPVRAKKREDLPKGEQEPKFFWAMAVWDVNNNKVAILEIDKRSIQRQLEEFITTEEWGSITNMCVEVKKTGQMRETRYAVVPLPKKKVPDEIQSEYESLNIDLTALYEGASPFKESAEEKTKHETVDLSDEEIESLSGTDEDFDKMVSDIIG